MERTLVFLLLVSLCVSQFTTPIKHVVVVMLENRSFDHVLGYLKTLNPEIDGLHGNETNPYDPKDPNSKTAKVSFDAPYLIGMDPGHSFQAMQVEIWGSNVEGKPLMNGFIVELTQSDMPIEQAVTIMRCYNSSSMPAISTLAMEFAVFDRWYSAIPTSTQPNRMMMHSATSHGAAHNIVDKLVEGYPQRVLYDDLYDSDVSFGIYFSDFPVCLDLRRIRNYPLHIHTLDDFIDDCEAGTLPSYSWVEPRWFDFLEWPENDAHPPHSAALSQFFIKEVYEALRASPNWNETLFVITFDEHGGTYDHVPPPQTGVPNPDGLNSTDPPFTFDRLGVRVPMVMVSPWIEKGTVVHEAKKNHFDHTSMAGTIRKMFSLKQPPLTKREAWSGTFESVINRQSPRTDCPTTLPVPPGMEQEWKKYIKAQRTKETPESIKEMILRNPNHIKDSPIVNEFQQWVVDVAWAITGGDNDKTLVNTVYESAVYARQQLKRWFEGHAINKSN